MSSSIPVRHILFVPPLFAPPLYHTHTVVFAPTQSYIHSDVCPPSEWGRGDKHPHFEGMPLQELERGAHSTLNF